MLKSLLKPFVYDKGFSVQMVQPYPEIYRVPHWAFKAMLIYMTHQACIL